MIRSRDAYDAAIDALHVDTAEEYKPGHLGAGLTWCNLFLHNATKALDCAIPFIKANAQVAWLASIEGAAQGWRELKGDDSRLEAQRRADAGYPTVAVWENPAGLDSHGHVAMVVPGVPWLKVVVTIAQAGAHNFRHAGLGNGFGNYPVRFFTHG